MTQASGVASRWRLERRRRRRGRHHHRGRSRGLSPCPRGQHRPAPGQCSGEWKRDRPGSLHELANFHAYDAAFTGGVWVAAADVTGDGIAESFTGEDAVGDRNVRVFQVTTAGPPGRGYLLYAEFFAYDPGFFGGVRVAAADSRW